MVNSDTFAGTLKASAEVTGSILSIGYDPAPQTFPIEGINGYDPNLPDPGGDYDEEVVSSYLIEYFEEFLASVDERDPQIGCFKFNLGYFRMYDRLESQPGLTALAEILSLADDYEIPIILDVKDADIARSSAAYAISKLKADPVDAITVHPYMGTDSVEPFFKFAHERGKGIYVLTRTTNAGATDFQDLTVHPAGAKNESKSGSEEPLYKQVARQVVEWSRSYPGTVGSAAAGNNVNELREIADLYGQPGREIPLLIPGVGTQGGSAAEVMQALDAAGYDHRLARINSSSGVMYRAQKDGLNEDNHAKASKEAINRLNDEIALSNHL